MNVVDKGSDEFAPTAFATIALVPNKSDITAAPLAMVTIPRRFTGSHVIALTTSMCLPKAKAPWPSCNCVIPWKEDIPSPESADCIKLLLFDK